VKGCSVHFRQAVNRRVQQEGLTATTIFICHNNIKMTAQYENEDSPIRRWIRQLSAMTALPAFAVPLIRGWLKCHLSSIHCRMAKPVLWRRTSSVHGFSATFRSVCMWSHYDNIGPRTTNVAEGFHNGFNSRFEKSHPSLRLFLALLLMPPFTTSTFLAAHSNDFRCRAA